MSNRRAASSSSGHSVAEIFGALMNVEFTGSIFPDAETLRNLGILEEVQTILQDMGIKNVLTIVFEAYQQPTCMFLASLEVFYSDGVEGDVNGGGFISFQSLNGNEERVTFKQLEMIYGFDSQRSRPDVFESATDETQTFWQMIGSTTFEAGRTDNSCIRHPAVRYVQQILANSFFSRRDAKIILEDDMDFLRLGIKRQLYNTLESQSMFHNDYNEKPCPLKIFLKQLLKFKRISWIAREGTKAQIRIGGWITPILRVSRVPLGGSAWTPRLMDIEYLRSIRYIVGQANDRYAYQFNSRNNTKEIIVLPNSRRTNFKRFNNVLFRQDMEDITSEGSQSGSN